MHKKHKMHKKHRNKTHKKYKTKNSSKKIELFFIEKKKQRSNGDHSAFI